jgi:hypothetical protein
MADGYLESHYAEYEKKKAEWLKKKSSPSWAKKCFPKFSYKYGKSNSKDAS